MEAWVDGWIDVWVCACVIDAMFLRCLPLPNYGPLLIVIEWFSCGLLTFISATFQ